MWKTEHELRFRSSIPCAIPSGEFVTPIPQECDEPCRYQRHPRQGYQSHPHATQTQFQPRKKGEDEKHRYEAVGHICILYPVGHLSIVSPSMKNVSTSESKSTLGYPFSLIGPLCRHMWAVCRCPLVSDAVRISQNAATNLPRPQTASHRIPPHPTAFPFTCTGLATSRSTHAPRASSVLALAALAALAAFR